MAPTTRPRIAVLVDGMTEDLREQITRRMGDVGGRLRVKSALNPVLWLCAVVTVPAIGFASYAKEPSWLVVCLVVMAFIPLVYAGVGFVVFLLRDPDKLQSEDYQIRKRTLELIAEKGRDGRIVELVETGRGLRLTSRDDHD